jgi:LPS sulfotransferase NodH
VVQGLPHIVVVASARTGTHLLRDIIAASGRHLNADELFLPPERCYPPHLPLNFWHRTAGFTAASRGETSLADARLAVYLGRVLDQKPEARLCMDVKYYHLPLLHAEAANPEVEAIRAFAAQGGRFVHLTRRNLLAQLVSIVRAEKTQEWVRSRAPRGNSSAAVVALDPTTLVARLARMAAERARIADLLAPWDPLEFAYEDLMEGIHPSPKLVAALRARFSCAVPQDYVPHFVKIGRSMRESISNLVAVERALAGSPFAAFLSG